jgi:hypothetical protein
MASGESIQNSGKQYGFDKILIVILFLFKITFPIFRTKNNKLYIVYQTIENVNWMDI